MHAHRLTLRVCSHPPAQLGAQEQDLQAVTHVKAYFQFCCSDSGLEECAHTSVSGSVSLQANGGFHILDCLQAMGCFPYLQDASRF